MLAFVLAQPVTTGAMAVFRRHPGVTRKLLYEAGERNDPNVTSVVTD